MMVSNWWEGIYHSIFGARQKRKQCVCMYVCSGGRCTEDEMNMLVPIVVGACLAGLIVIVLVAYFIGRYHSKRGYENV